MRVSTVLLVGLALSALSPFVSAQTPSPGAPPAFEYLGTLRAETGSRTVVENGPQGARTIVEVVGGRFAGPRLKAAVQAIGVGERVGTTVKYDVYALK